jgi:hypothetical protein
LWKAKGRATRPPRRYTNTVEECDQRFQECKKNARRKALKGGFIVFVASATVFDLGGTLGCSGTGPLFVECFLAIEHLQTAITPILLAPFGGDYFANLAECWNQRAICLGKTCKQ